MIPTVVRARAARAALNNPEGEEVEKVVEMVEAAAAPPRRIVRGLGSACRLVLLVSGWRWPVFDLT